MSELSPNTINLIKQRNAKQLKEAGQIIDATLDDAYFVLGENVIPDKVADKLVLAYKLIYQYREFLETGEVSE